MKCWAGWITSWKKIARRNINNLIYADDTTLMAESDEELKNLLMRVKEENEKAENSTFKKQRSWHLVPSLHGKLKGKKWKQWQFFFLGLQNHCRRWLQPWNGKMLAPWKESYDKPSCCSVPRSCLTLCDPMKHARPPCPSPTPGLHPNSSPSSRWCHPAISSSDALSPVFNSPSIRDFSNESFVHVR